MEENFVDLRLKNQICFPLYAVSRLVIKQYKPFLEKLGVTYPQYLVLLVLWEKDTIPVKEISAQLLLETNTLTPLLKRMETSGLLTRSRSTTDERVVIISLTLKGKDLYHQAIKIPNKLLNSLNCSYLEEEEVFTLKKVLDKIIDIAKEK